MNVPEDRTWRNTPRRGLRLCCARITAAYLVDLERAPAICLTLGVCGSPGAGL
jgi:hypothetical protein